ncbi:MAG: hypothetical protein LBL95_09420, partial [Deltaproteobacteria bacterium]|nr:hypothetical protein [Deltaproteobacteria bacterium]
MTDQKKNEQQPGTIDAQYEEITGSREIVEARPENFRPPVARDRQTQMAIWRESLDMALDQRAIIQEAMKSFLVLGKHYGPMPGAKPDGKDGNGNPIYSRMVLFKPGADAICAFFRLVPEFKIEREFLPGGHLNAIATCPLRNGNGDIVANGMGSCSTMEKKYRWRAAEMPCPNCGQPLRKSQFGPEFYCNAKAGGCGAKIHEDDPKVANFHAGKVENPDLADIYNTVIKMAAKRAQVDATLRGTNCADVFTQDLEDLSSRLDDNAAEQPARPNGHAAKADPAPQKRAQAN